MLYLKLGGYVLYMNIWDIEIITHVRAAAHLFPLAYSLFSVSKNKRVERERELLAQWASARKRDKKKERNALGKIGILLLPEIRPISTRTSLFHIYSV